VQTNAADDVCQQAGIDVPAADDESDVAAAKAFGLREQRGDRRRAGGVAPLGAISPGPAALAD